jgi:hypothetical protein
MKLEGNEVFPKRFSKNVFLDESNDIIDDERNEKIGIEDTIKS